ncbi:hypothetical protein CLOM_g22124 [Closterium sp. NIES-68]|nr:hypothetical protein CLOM_g22124 [Closterium sp. NIES-68]GJP74474.1 hypothetical protein CLOP_g5047 [Closterium sp. NIES-67]
MAAATRAGIDTTGVLGMWPSEEAMACYLIAHAYRFRGRRVVELGAGYGLAGMALAVQQEGVGRVLLTDGNDSVVARLHRTVAANRQQFGPSQVSVMGLRWDHHPPKHHWPPGLSPPFHALIAADCTFFKEHHEHLLRTITALLTVPSPQPSSVPPATATTCDATLPTTQQPPTPAAVTASAGEEAAGSAAPTVEHRTTAAAARATSTAAAGGGTTTPPYPPEAFLFAPHRGSSLSLFLARVQQQGEWHVRVEERYHEAVSRAFGEEWGEAEEEEGEGEGEERKEGEGVNGKVRQGEEEGAGRGGVEGMSSERRGSERERRQRREPWEGYDRMHDYPVMVHMTWAGRHA